MAGSDNLTGILVGVGAIVSAMGLLYLTSWMARISRTVREHELQREHHLAELKTARVRPLSPEAPAIRRAA